MRDYTGVPVSELREYLVKLGLTKEEADSIKGKSRLVAEIEKRLNKSQEDMVEEIDFNDESNFEMVEDEQSHEAVYYPPEETEVPDITSVEWTDYVLSHLEEDEKFEENPTVDGLRRLAEKFVGPILESKSKVVGTPTNDNGMRSTVVHTITFYPCQLPSLYEQEVKYSGSADVGQANAKHPYNLFPTSMAETRAEGRALRRALRLRKVVAAEELQFSENIPTTVVPEQKEGFITDVQIRFIDMICGNGPRGKNLNVKKLINFVTKKDYNNVRDVSYEESLEIQEQLSKFQQEPDSIPAELIGYDENWRN